MIAKFVRLEFELFPKPSDSDFLRIHQNCFYKLFLLYKFFAALRETFFNRPCHVMKTELKHNEPG